ncbi:MAG: 3-methyladenine DNA glycosylase, partial [Actinomycetota bacterium]|nr:3-methyladenine DNA glycosylase [Actinomycetota bacterium]
MQVGTVMSRAEWEPLAEAHAARVDRYTRPHLERREARVKHPVHDFLFTYYSQRPAQLRRWHPGVGVALEDAPEHESWKGYRVVWPSAGHGPRSATRVEVDPAYVAAQRPLVEAIRRLLVATASRPAQLGCFGLHEWAMVHRSPASETRHGWPLRLGGAGTDRVVESHRIACSHFDAFR